MGRSNMHKHSSFNYYSGLINMMINIFRKNFYLFLGFILLYFFGVSESLGQTYTFNPSKVGCNGLWTTAACWDKVNTGCSNNSNAVPPLGSGLPNNCPVIINVNHQVNATSLTFAGTNITLNLGPNGVLNLSANMNISKGTNTTVNLNGGEVKIAGTLNVAMGTGNSLALINISGNGAGKGIFANNLNLNNNSMVNIEPNGVLIVEGPTIFAANNTNITNKGFFRTRSLDVRGQATVDNLGNGVIVIDEDLIIRGNSDLTVTGNSEVEIGGSIDFDGNNGRLNVQLEGSVRVCGEGDLPSESGPNVNVDRPTATYEKGNCRLLPVEYLYIKSQFIEDNRSTVLSWATTKEWESSHFEIQRAVNGLNFEKISEVQAVGWSNTITEYKFFDQEIPLVGGNLFYRLKQVDFSGIYDYSKVVSVRIPSEQNIKGVWRAFPNPTSGDQFRLELLQMQEYTGEEIQVELISPSAEAVLFRAGNMAEISRQVQAKLLNAPKGIYLIHISWGGKKEFHKLVKN